MLLNVRAAATYELAAESFMYLMVEPSLIGSTHRVLDERLVTTPTHFCELRRDLYGNLQRQLVGGKGTFRFEFNATIEAAPNAALSPEATEQIPEQLPPEVMIYTLPSRYCQSDLLTRMARLEFGHVSPGGRRVLAISEWVRQHVDYVYGTTDSRTSAFDTATERVGVCRDFAHLVIAFCRGLDIPARYVSGYALGLAPRTSTATHRSIWEERGTILTRRPRRSGPPWCRFAWDETPPTSPSPPSGASARWSNRPCWCTRLEHEWPRDLSEGHGPERRNNSSIKPDVLQSSLRPI